MTVFRWTTLSQLNLVIVFSVLKKHEGAFFLLNDESEKNMGGSWHTFLLSWHRPPLTPQEKEESGSLLW